METQDREMGLRRQCEMGTLMSSWIGVEDQLYQLCGKPDRSVLQDLSQAKASEAGNRKRWGIQIREEKGEGKETAGFHCPQVPGVFNG